MQEHDRSRTKNWTRFVKNFVPWLNLWNFWRGEEEREGGLLKNSFIRWAAITPFVIKKIKFASCYLVDNLVSSLIYSGRWYLTQINLQCWDINLYLELVLRWIHLLLDVAKNQKQSWESALLLLGWETFEEILRPLQNLPSPNMA